MTKNDVRELAKLLAEDAIQGIEWITVIETAEAEAIDAARTEGDK